MANNRRRLYIRLEHRTNKLLDAKGELIERVIRQLNQDLKDYFCYLEMLRDGDSYEEIDDFIIEYLQGVKKLLEAEPFSKVEEVYAHLVVKTTIYYTPLAKRIVKFSSASRYNELSVLEFSQYILKGYIGVNSVSPE